MRVLILDEWLPYPADSGKRLRSYELLRRLARDHDLMWVAPAEGTGGAAADALRGDGFTVETVRAPVLTRSDPRFYLGALASVASRVPYVVTLHRAAALERRIAELHRARPFDLLHVEWTPLAANLPRGWDRPWVVDAHNLESRIWERTAEVAGPAPLRAFYRLEARRMARFERDVFGRAAGVVTVSELEKHEILALGGRAWVVENGVDLVRLQPTATPEEPQLVFTGALDWAANVDAVEHFVRNLWPGIRAACPRLRFLAVGRAPAPAWKARMEETPGVEVHGSVPDVRPYLDSAAIVVVPLRVGGGTRLKILEALAMGKSVISTAVGAEGLEIVAGEDYLSAETPEDWAQAVSQLERRPERRRELGRSGRRRIEPRYGWDSLARKLEAAWREILGRGGVA